MQMTLNLLSVLAASDTASVTQGTLNSNTLATVKLHYSRTP